MVKDRPILFSGDMVRAIIGGRKTQTRRVVKPQPVPYGSLNEEAYHSEHAAKPWYPIGGVNPEKWPCPYGVPGDRLWVRETFRHFGNSSSGREPVRAHVKYRADDAVMQCGEWPNFDIAPNRAWWNTGRYPWTPGIHMPRWASRLTLELTGVRVERLQAISEEDARAEGVLSLQMDMGSFLPSFEGLWDSINSNRGFGWDTNPWVWVLEFRRVTP